MTRAQWLIEEEERLIRVRDEIDSILGVHAAHCEKCGPGQPLVCEITDNLSAATNQVVYRALLLNQQRQDEEQPLPHYSPVKL